MTVFAFQLIPPEVAGSLSWAEKLETILTTAVGGYVLVFIVLARQRKRGEAELHLKRGQLYIEITPNQNPHGLWTVLTKKNPYAHRNSRRGVRLLQLRSTDIHPFFGRSLFFDILSFLHQ